MSLENSFYYTFSNATSQLLFRVFDLIFTFLLVLTIMMDYPIHDMLDVLVVNSL